MAVTLALGPRRVGVGATIRHRALVGVVAIDGDHLRLTVGGDVDAPAGGGDHRDEGIWVGVVIDDEAARGEIRLHVPDSRNGAQPDQ
jgi:hypothetical protein